MQIFDDNKKRVALITAFSNREIETTLSSGDKILRFEYPANDKKSALLKEEYYIRTETDEYVIKAIEKGDKYNRYEACLNVEELEGIIFPYGFESRTQTIRAALEFAFQGSGWTVGVCDLQKKRTINRDEVCTAWDILQDALKTYMCECIIDTLHKKVDVYEKVGSYKGCYFVEGLNLRKLGEKSDTYEFYTRIYPIGKDGITPELTIGKDYIDNNSYSKKIRPFVWKDERYENTTALIEDATAKLESLAKPLKAYEIEVIDLAKINPKYKNILDFKIGDTVKIISKKKNIKEIQRIVKIKEYPENPEKNTAEISNAKKTFAEIQEEANETLRTDSVNVAVSTAKRIIADGYYNKTETKMEIATSKEAILLGVDQKLENYPSKEEMKTELRIESESITQTVSKTYETIEGSTQKKNDAIAAGQAAADQAESNAESSLSSYKKEVGTYFRHDVKGLELGEVAADTKINITPKAVEFSDGGVVTAFVNNKAFRFTEGVVENRLRIGGYVFKKEPSGEVSLEWEESETTIEEASVL